MMDDETDLKKIFTFQEWSPSISSRIISIHHTTIHFIVDRNDTEVCEGRRFFNITLYAFFPI